jgi:hypothetical protein
MRKAKNDPFSDYAEIIDPVTGKTKYYEIIDIFKTIN